MTQVLGLSSSLFGGSRQRLDASAFPCTAEQQGPDRAAPAVRPLDRVFSAEKATSPHLEKSAFLVAGAPVRPKPMDRPFLLTLSAARHRQRSYPCSVGAPG